MTDSKERAEEAEKDFNDFKEWWNEQSILGINPYVVFSHFGMYFKPKWKSRPKTELKKGNWEIKAHSYPIADTGDYDGCYEITNGKISLFTKDGDDEDENSLPQVIQALNDCDCDFYLDDSAALMLSVVEQELKELRETQPQHPVSEDEGGTVSAEEYEDAVNHIGQLQEQIKEMQDEIRELNKY